MCKLEKWTSRLLQERTPLPQFFTKKIITRRKKINEALAGQNRSELYGKQNVSALWRQLTNEYGTAFSEKNLRRMMQFAEVFPDEQIVVLLIRQLSWTHLLVLIPIKDPLKRDFYIEMCKLEKCSSKQSQERHSSP
jgi:hypothetical protein